MSEWKDVMGVRLERFPQLVENARDEKADWTDICILMNDDYEFKVIKRHGIHGRVEEEKPEKKVYDDIDDAAKRVVTITSFMVTWRPRRMKLPGDEKAEWHKLEPEYSVADVWGEMWPDALVKLERGLDDLNYKWQG